MPAATRSRSTPKRLSCTLLERLELTPDSHVDQERCIIHGVKVLGKHSKNKHGFDVDSSEYTDNALERALPIFEGLKVNLGHPPKANPGMDRDPDDRHGKLMNVKLTPDGYRAELHLLKTHPMTARLLEAASDPRFHDMFALSINAGGRGTIRNRRYMIDEIPYARSVDIVCDGGTTTSLYESYRAMKTVPLRTLMESFNKDTKKIFARLLEDDAGMGDMAMPEAPAAETSEKGWKEHCAELLKAIAMDENMSSEERMEKAKMALKCLEEAATDVEEEDEEGGEEEGKKKKAELEEARDSAGHGWSNNNQRKAAQARMTEDDDRTNTQESGDSRRFAKEYAEYQQLKAERKVTELCESLQFTPTKMQVKALVGMTDSDRRAFVRELKASQNKNPRTGPTTAVARPVMESRDNEALVTAEVLDDESRKRLAHRWSNRR